MAFLPGFEDADDEAFHLTQAHSLTVAAYMQTKHFQPILIALDTDEERVAKRARQAKACSDWDEKHRNESAVKAAAWLGCITDDLPSMPVMQTPTRFNVSLRRMLRDGLDKEATPPCYDMICSMVMMQATAQQDMAWQMNALRDRMYQQEATQPSPDHKATLIARFPYLADCKESVWDIPHNKHVTQLSRSMAVRSFSFRSYLSFLNTL